MGDTLRTDIRHTKQMYQTHRQIGKKGGERQR